MADDGSGMFGWLTGKKKPKQKSVIEQQRDATNSAMDDLFGPEQPLAQKRKGVGRFGK